MNRTQLNEALKLATAAKNGANWQGKFTPEIREETVIHRAEYIAKPLDKLIAMLNSELANGSNKPKRKGKRVRNYRPPYKDD